MHQAGDYGHRLIELFHTPTRGRKVPAVPLVLIFVPTCTDAEQRPSATEVVYRHHLLGEKGRVPVSGAIASLVHDAIYSIRSPGTVR